MQALPEFIRALMLPDAYPHPVRTVELRQTHISWVLLTGEIAYKVKKPVAFGFIDATSLDKRQRMCVEELRLNRRLAPQLYLDVVPIGGSPKQPRVGIGQNVFEWAVSMRQFDGTQELAALLASGEPLLAELEEFATRLARFHARTGGAPPDPGYGTFEHVRHTMLDNVAALSAQPVRADDVARLAQLDKWLRAALGEAGPSMRARRASGSVRECHGDLHAHNIVRWDGALLPFDCLEFDPALRWTDVASELAFLHVDLLGHGRRDLAALLLATYLDSSGDYGALRVMRLYEVHAALVRAKVHGLTAQGAESPAYSLQADDRRTGRISLAARRTQEKSSLLLLMHGVSASGKSRVSRELVTSLGIPRVRSDIERKRLAGLSAQVDATARPGAGLYAECHTEATYDRLRDCAEHALAGGYGVIVDAASLERRQRAAFHSLAGRHGARFLIVSCGADRATLVRRLAARRSGEQLGPSDATLAVLDHQLASAQPLGPEELACTLHIDTGATSPQAAAALVRAHVAEGQ